MFRTVYVCYSVEPINSMLARRMCRRRLLTASFLCSYIFLEYGNPRDASDAVTAATGYKLDKQHTFVVNLFSDFDKYVRLRSNVSP